MSAIVKPARSPVLAGRLERLRLQAMASEMAPLVGRNIQRAREAQGLYNQREFAEAIRKLDPQRAASNTAVSEWERGIRKPGDRYMKLIAEVLDKPIDWFMRDHDRPAETPDLFAAPDEPDGILVEITELLAQMQRDELQRYTALLARLDGIEATIQALGRQRLG